MAKAATLTRPTRIPEKRAASGLVSGAALSRSDEPSDQMVDVLCNMHRNGFPEEALLKVIAANNGKKS